MNYRLFKKNAHSRRFLKDVKQLFKELVLKVKKHYVFTFSILFIVVIIFFILINKSDVKAPGAIKLAVKSSSTKSQKQSSSNNSSTPASKSSAGTNAVLSSPPKQAILPPIYPSSVLNLTNWKLTLPTNTSYPGDPDEISQPELASFNDPPYFYVNSQRNGVVFEAPVGGATTSNSDYPRSELREMTDNGAQTASWSTTSGTSTMTIREAITHLPSARPELVAGQIHGPSDYVILIRLNGNTLFVEYNGENVGTLDKNYSLGTIFTVQVEASSGYIKVYFNGQQDANLANKTSGDYFKAGCYTQSNPTDGDSPSAYGQVIIYNLQVTHT